MILSFLEHNNIKDMPTMYRKATDESLYHFSMINLKRFNNPKPYLLSWKKSGNLEYSV